MIDWPCLMCFIIYHFEVTGGMFWRNKLRAVLGDNKVQDGSPLDMIYINIKK